MAYTIGVDVGGTKVLGGVVDESGTVVKTATARHTSRGWISTHRRQLQMLPKN